MRSTNPASTSRSEGLGSIFMKRTGGNPVDFCRLKDRPPIDSQRAFDTLHHKIAATAANDSRKRPRTMTSAHSLQGLMKWLTRAEWRDRFAEVYDHHLLPACRRTGLDAEEVMAILGENWFMTTIWGGAFEDFLTREGTDGRNIVDDYLKRRGWKESASTRAYMSIIANLGDEPLRGQRYSPRHVVSGAGPCARGRSNSDQRKVGNALPQTVGPHRHACYSGRIADAYQRGRVAVRPRCLGEGFEVVAQCRKAQRQGAAKACRPGSSRCQSSGDCQRFLPDCAFARCGAGDHDRVAHRHH